MLLLVLGAWLGSRLLQPSASKPPGSFDGQQAYRDVKYQVSLGPRVPGSPAHQTTVDWMVSELKRAGWQAEVQETTMLGHPVRNVVGKWGQGAPWVVLGAHFDSRISADQDPNPQNFGLAVPGANDGASGVAVLLELARELPSHWNQAVTPRPWPGQIWLVFFDAEDNGELPSWDWLLGSKAFVASLVSKPDQVVVIDMIGDANLDIYREKNSDPKLTDEVFAQAAALGYSKQFIDQPKYSMIDDHTPFLQAGIRAIDLIDFDYPYWHTIADTADKVSEQSLKAVGDTLLAWLTKTR